MQTHTFQHFSLYVGTDKNCILEGSLQHKFSYIMWGHVGQVLAIAPHPSDTATFATGGANDRMVVKWRKQRVAWKLEIQSAICSLSWHTNGKVVVAGTEEGNLMALNGESGWLTPYLEWRFETKEFFHQDHTCRGSACAALP